MPDTRETPPGSWTPLTSAASPTASGLHTTVVSPLNGEPLAEVPLNTRQDVREAALRGRAAQRRWRESSFRERGRIILRFHDLLLERQGEALDLIQQETGKARRHALEEVLDTALVARYYAKTAPGVLKTKRRQSPFPLLSKTWENRCPKGLCGFIVPWNYPLDLAVTDAIPALLAGNAALIKPDIKTPLSALWAVRLMREAGLPADLAQVVVGDGAEIGAAVIPHSDFVMFTGSAETGRVVARQAAEQLTDFSLELGGKNAMLALEDADVSGAVIGAEQAAFASGGQLCVAAERIYIHESLYDEFAARFANRVRDMKLNARLDYSADMGSLVSRDHLRTVSSFVREAVSKGARLLAGGRPRPDLGDCFYEPTVLEGVTEDMSLHTEEVFGPVVALYPFRDEEEAARLVNDGRYGLNASIWTRDAGRGRRLASRLEVGTVGINDAYTATWAATDAPMGGFKESGMGRRHGAEGLLKYTEAQTVAEKRLTLKGSLPGGDAERYAKLITAALKVARHLPTRRLR